MTDASPSIEFEDYPGERHEPSEDAKGPRPFTVWAPSQFLAFKPSEGAIVLGDSILERGKWTSFVGVGGLGKTRLMLWLAVCQILGRPWCGLEVHGNPLRWLLLSTENGLRRWQTDLTAMFGGLSQEERNLIEANLLILALSEDEDGDLNAGSLEAMARLAVTLREHKPDVIGFDPFADMIDGDENKTEDVVQTLRTLRQIVRKDAPNAAVLLIHHARTGAANIAQAGDNFSTGNFGRGAKALYSMARAELQLAPGDRDDSNKLVLACGKNSDGPKFAARGVIFDPPTCSYRLDPAFNLDDWRADVSGKRTGKSCTITNAVEAVRELASMAGTEAKTGDIIRLMTDATGAGIRTCKTRLTEATKSGYIRKGSRLGFYRLGSKPIAH